MNRESRRIKRIKRVLIIDDNRDVRTLLRNILEYDGCTVWSAGSGEEAFGILNSCEPETILPVVLSDIALPGMDGLTLGRKLRVHEPLKLLIAITGYTDCFSLVECRDAGFDDYIVKPFDKAVVTASVQNAFKRFFYWERMLNYDKSHRPWRKKRSGWLWVL